MPSSNSGSRKQQGRFLAPLGTTFARLSFSGPLEPLDPPIQKELTATWCRLEEGEQVLSQLPVVPSRQHETHN